MRAPWKTMASSFKPVIGHPEIGPLPMRWFSVMEDRLRRLEEMIQQRALTEV